ncbi:MAG: hypothetical protein ACLSUX_06985 [Christensenellales bacterium]|jgi:hypothetical protein
MKNHIQMNKIEFMIGDLYDRDSVKDRNDFYLTEDRSLLYQSTTNGDYSILLGGNWRFELIVDSSTGLCIKFQSFLDELKVLHKPLVLPESKARRVFIKSGEMLFPGEGCHYHPFSNKVYWDERKNILCIGNPESIGEVIEFAPHIIMVVKSHQLHCLYLTLNNISGIDFL